MSVSRRTRCRLKLVSIRLAPNILNREEEDDL